MRRFYTHLKHVSLKYGLDKF
jgi:hypothetical protein